MTKLLDALDPVKELFRTLLLEPEKQPFGVIDEVVPAYLDRLFPEQLHHEFNITTILL